MIQKLHRVTDARGRRINLRDIQDLIDRLVHKWNPSAIWLFGSRARGDAGNSSDWDLLVIVPEEAHDLDDPLAAWRIRKEAGVPADVILCAQLDFQDARETPNTLAYEAAHYGVLIYER